MPELNWQDQAQVLEDLRSIRFSLESVAESLSVISVALTEEEEADGKHKRPKRARG